MWADNVCGLGGDSTGEGYAVETGPFRKGECNLTPSADEDFLSRNFAPGLLSLLH